MVSTSAARSLVSSQIQATGNDLITATDVRSVFLSTLDALDKTDNGIPAITDYNAAAGDGTTNPASAIASGKAHGAYRFTGGVYRIASSITLDGYIYVLPGALIRPAAGVTVTISGHLSAGRHPIFDLSLGGTVVGAPAHQTPFPLTHVYPEWWGTTGTGVNSSPAIQAAINFAQTASGGTVLLRGWYRCDQTLVVSGRVGIEGQGPVYGTSLGDGGIEKSTTLEFNQAAANAGGISVQSGSGTINGFQLKNVGMYRNPPGPKTGTGVGLHLVSVQRSLISQCHIFGFSIGLQVDDSAIPGIRASYDGSFEGCTIGGGGRAAAIIGGCAGFTFRDCTFWSGEPNLDQIVLFGRGAGGMKPDTVSIENCRIQYLHANTAGRPQVLVRILDGMWLNFVRTDLEEAAEAGILVQRDSTANHADIGLKTIDVLNCWFNAAARNVVFSGFRANGTIQNCRMENASGGTSVIALEFTTLLDADILIRGNNIRNSGTTGAIAATNASGIRISENYIYGADAGVSAPGVVLAGSVTNSIVTANRVRSNHAAPISNGGSNNTVSNNVVGVV